MATDRVLNADMLEAGQAWAYPAFCNAPFCNGWKKLEQDAKEARRGLWSRKDPTRRGSGGRSGNEESPGCFDPRALFYWLGGVRPGRFHRIYEFPAGRLPTCDRGRVTFEVGIPMRLPMALERAASSVSPADV